MGSTRFVVRKRLIGKYGGSWLYALLARVIVSDVPYFLTFNDHIVVVKVPISSLIFHLTFNAIRMAQTQKNIETLNFA